MNPFVLSLIIGSINALPILVWGSYFLHKHNERRKWVLYSFGLGGLLVVPLVFMKQLSVFLPFLDFQSSLNQSEALQASILTVPLTMISFFVIVGVVEEYLKHKVADKVPKNEITSFDDAIEFSIMAALGFAFAENTFYLINIWQYLDTQTFWSVYLLRAVFSTFAHCLFSTVYGYYFGLSLFPNQVYNQETYHRFSLSRLIQRCHCRLSKSFLKKFFIAESQFIGLFYAASLHAIFNIFLELQITIFLVPFLIFGMSFVSKLINDKKNLKELA